MRNEQMRKFFMSLLAPEHFKAIIFIFFWISEEYKILFLYVEENKIKKKQEKSITQYHNICGEMKF